jgi:hypothetical protein
MQQAIVESARSEPILKKRIYAEPHQYSIYDDDDHLRRDLCWFLTVTRNLLPPTKKIQLSLSNESNNFIFIKFNNKLLIFISSNKFSIKIYYMINLMILILQHKY